MKYLLISSIPHQEFCFRSDIDHYFDAEYHTKLCDDLNQLRQEIINLDYNHEVSINNFHWLSKNYPEQRYRYCHKIIPEGSSLDYIESILSYEEVYNKSPKFEEIESEWVLIAADQELMLSNLRANIARLAKEKQEAELKRQKEIERQNELAERSQYEKLKKKYEGKINLT